MSTAVLDPHSMVFWTRIGATILCGGIIGIERQLRGKAAGIGAAIAFDQLAMALAITLVTVGVLVGVEVLESTFIKLRRGVHSKYRKNNDYSGE